MASIPDNRKSRGRPKTGIGKPVGLRLYGDMERALDRAAHEAGKSRPDVVRDALAEWLKKRGYVD